MWWSNLLSRSENIYFLFWFPYTIMPSITVMITQHFTWTTSLLTFHYHYPNIRRNTCTTPSSLHDFLCLSEHKTVHPNNYEQLDEEYDNLCILSSSNPFNIPHYHHASIRNATPVPHLPLWMTFSTCLNIKRCSSTTMNPLMKKTIICTFSPLQTPSNIPPHKKFHRKIKTNTFSLHKSYITLPWSASTFLSSSNPFQHSSTQEEFHRKLKTNTFSLHKSYIMLPWPASTFLSI